MSDAMSMAKLGSVVGIWRLSSLSLVIETAMVARSMLSCSQSRYLEFAISVAGDVHELDVTWLPQDDVVRPREINYLECKRLSAVIA
jgi:hypothetical protein